MAKIEVTATATVFDGYDHEGGEREIEAEIIRVAADKLAESVKSKVIERIESMVEAQATDQITAIVKNAIEGEIHTTNSYGEKTGKTVTVRGLLMEKVQEMFKPKSNYSNRDSMDGRADNLVQECVNQFLSKEMVTELNGIKAKLKGALTTAVLGNLQKQVTDVIKGY